MDWPVVILGAIAAVVVLMIAWRWAIGIAVFLLVTAVLWQLPAVLIGYETMDRLIHDPLVQIAYFGGWTLLSGSAGIFVAMNVVNGEARRRTVSRLDQWWRGTPDSRGEPSLDPLPEEARSIFVEARNLDHDQVQALLVAEQRAKNTAEWRWGAESLGRLMVSARKVWESLDDFYAPHAFAEIHDLRQSWWGEDAELDEVIDAATALEQIEREGARIPWAGKETEDAVHAVTTAAMAVVLENHLTRQEFDALTHPWRSVTGANE